MDAHVSPRVTGGKIVPELDAAKPAADIHAMPPSVVYVAAGLVLLAGYYAIPSSHNGPNMEWKVGLYLFLSASAPAAVLFGILRYRPARPLPWCLVLANQIVYASADATFFVRHDLLGLTQYPALSDVLYLGHYPLMIAALVVFIRRRTPGGDRSALIDGSILVVVATMLSWIFVIAPSFDAPGQAVLARVTSAAYPTMDLAMFAILLWMVVGARHRKRAFWTLAAALVLLFVSDTIYALQQIAGAYHPGSFLDGMWVGYYLLVGAAMLSPSMTNLGTPSPARELPPDASRFLGIGMATLAVPAVLLVEQNRHTAYFFPVVAAGTTLLFTLVIARLMCMISDQRRMAITDSLTGLRNRRYFEAHYAVDCARATRSYANLSMVLFDVDYFKSVNDEYGHFAGDLVLAEIARRLSGEVRAGDVVSRYGGEEFAVLLFGAQTAEARDVAERVRDAIAGVPFDIGAEAPIPLTISAGVVAYPEHVSDASELCLAADRAMYAAKEAGRNRVVTGSFDPPPSFLRRGPANPVLDYLEALTDRVDLYQAPVEHGSAIARWSVAMANELGLDESAQRRCNLSARLHDIGKVTVPIHILEKEGHLSVEDWTFIHDHPARGEFLISAAPGLQAVAEIVGQHHERVDGTGYPRGLRGPEIRIEARILSVCDAFASMCASRPYRAALTGPEARAQLLDARGGQLSADLVDLFLDLLDRELVGHLGQLQHGGVQDNFAGRRQIGISTALSS